MSQFERVCSRAAFLTSVFLCHAGILPGLSTHLCSFHPFSVSIKTFSEVKCSCEACASLLSTWNKSLKLIFFTLTEGSWVKKTSQWLIKNVWMGIRSQQTVGSFVSDVLNHLLFHLKRSTPFHKRKMFFLEREIHRRKVSFSTSTTSPTTCQSHLCVELDGADCCQASFQNQVFIKSSGYEENTLQPSLQLSHFLTSAGTTLQCNRHITKLFQFFSALLASTLKVMFIVWRYRSPVLSGSFISALIWKETKWPMKAIKVCLSLLVKAVLSLNFTKTNNTWFNFTFLNKILANQCFLSVPGSMSVP